MRPRERPTPRRTVQPEEAVVVEGRLEWQVHSPPQLPGARVGVVGSAGRAATRVRVTLGFCKKPLIFWLFGHSIFKHPSVLLNHPFLS
jgi:hypothetical protein